jgi:hypothetical protein
MTQFKELFLGVVIKVKSYSNKNEKYVYVNCLEPDIGNVGFFSQFSCVSRE